MRLFIFSFVSVLALSTLAMMIQGESQPSMPTVRKVMLAVHGGAGVPSRQMMTPEREKKLRADLERALRAGQKSLQAEGGTCLDGVEAAIRILENSSLFNAGKGAVFTHEGRHELDASLMEGKEKRAGAV